MPAGGLLHSPKQQKLNGELWRTTGVLAERPGIVGGCCRRTVERLLCLESAAAELFLQAIPEAPSWDMGRCLRATAPHPAVTRHRAAKLPLEPVASLMALPAKTACQAVPRRQCWAQSQQCQSIHHCQPYLGAVLTVGYSRSPRDMGPPRGGEQREGRAGGGSE